MLYGRRREYHPVAQDATNSSDRHVRPSGLLFVSIIALVSGLLGFTGGLLFSASHPDRFINTMILHEPGVNIREIYTGIDTTFTYNRTFGADPEVDTATLDAWDSVVPRTFATLLVPIGQIENTVNKFQRFSWTGYSSIPASQRPVLHTVRRAPAALPRKCLSTRHHHAKFTGTKSDPVVPSPVPLHDPASRQ